MKVCATNRAHGQDLSGTIHSCSWLPSAQRAWPKRVHHAHQVLCQSSIVVDSANLPVPTATRVKSRVDLWPGVPNPLRRVHSSGHYHPYEAVDLSCSTSARAAESAPITRRAPRSSCCGRRPSAADIHVGCWSACGRRIGGYHSLVILDAASAESRHRTGHASWRRPSAISQRKGRVKDHLIQRSRHCVPVSP